MTNIGAMNNKPTLNSEEAMLLLCARSRIPDSLSERVQALAPEINWHRFSQLAMEQGVASLAYPNLKRYLAHVIPAEVLSLFSRHAMDNAQSNLSLMKELLDVTSQLKAEGIDCAVFKGISINQLVYHDFSIRKCGDIDLLVRKKDFHRARSKYQSMGFQRTLSDESEAACLQSALWHEQRRLKVDLHWGIPPSQLGIKAEKILDRLSEMPIGGSSVNVFSMEDLFISLCTNAVKEYWEQFLYPYCDIHDFMQSDIELNWQFVLDRAGELRCRRPVISALGVVASLFEIKLSPVLEQWLVPLSPSGMVSRELQMQLFEKDRSRSAAFDPEGGRHLHCFRSADAYFISLMDHRIRRIGYRYLKFLQPNAADRALIKLPEELAFLYYFVRPFRLIGRQGRRLASWVVGKSEI